MRTTLRGSSQDIVTLAAQTGIDLNPTDSPFYQQYLAPQVDAFAASPDGQALIRNLSNVPAVHDQLTMAAVQGAIEKYWPWGVGAAVAFYLFGRN